MGSTAKIYFRCFIAVSIVVMFLLFSMQNSAQLKLDIQDIQNSVSEKEQQITTIKNDLESAKAAVQDIHEQDNVISELKGHVQTKEKENLVLTQQLADFQIKLQNQTAITEKRLAEISILKKQQQRDQELPIKGDDSKAAADNQKAEFTTALQLVQKKLAKSEQSLSKVVETLDEKDRVILMCKTDLTKITGELVRMQDEDSYEKLNFNLIFDELVRQANIVEELTYKLEQAERSVIQEKQL